MQLCIADARSLEPSLLAHPGPRPLLRRLDIYNRNSMSQYVIREGYRSLYLFVKKINIFFLVGV